MNQIRKVVESGFKWYFLVSVVENYVFEPWDQGFISYLILEKFSQMMLSQASTVLVEMAPGVIALGLHLVRRFILNYIVQLSYTTSSDSLIDKAGTSSPSFFKQMQKIIK